MTVPHPPLLERAAGQAPGPHEGQHVTPVIWSAIAGDHGLSWAAKGILLYMATRLHNRPVTMSELLAIAQDSHAAVAAGLAELAAEVAGRTSWIRPAGDGWVIAEELESPAVDWPQQGRVA